MVKKETWKKKKKSDEKKESWRLKKSKIERYSEPGLSC